MSNFSNIGFSVENEEAFNQLLHAVYEVSKPVKIAEGSYSIYTDPSGAELYIQSNGSNECIGINPHFKGRSRRTVRLMHAVARTQSELDGAFYAWADPADDNNPESGAYPFVFDLPDFKTMGEIKYPFTVEIQLSAFAHELSIYSSEKEYEDSQTTEFKYAAQSFIPSGLFQSDEESASPQAHAIFSGIIKSVEKKQNHFTQEVFYWLLVDTLGGEVDVVADVNFFEAEPVVNGIVHGHFWLSGKLIDPPVRKDKSLFKKLLGK